MSLKKYLNLEWRVGTVEDNNCISENYNIVIAGDGYDGESGEGFTMTSFVPVEVVRFIAAAPDLFRALYALLCEVNVRIDDPRIALFDAARAAIAKATGDQC
jgi:hypothetical protein